MSDKELIELVDSMRPFTETWTPEEHTGFLSNEQIVSALRYTDKVLRRRMAEDILALRCEVRRLKEAK